MDSRTQNTYSNYNNKSHTCRTKRLKLFETHPGPDAAVMTQVAAMHVIARIIFTGVLDAGTAHKNVRIFVG